MNLKKAKALRRLASELKKDLSNDGYEENVKNRKTVDYETIDDEGKPVTRLRVLAAGTIRASAGSVRGLYLKLKKMATKEKSV